MILRYPGGKKKVAAKLASVLVPCTEIREPFFGSGAVTFAALSRLDAPSQVWINDLDPGIAALFTSIIQEPEHLKSLIGGFTPSVSDFKAFKESLLSGEKMPQTVHGFRKLAVHQMSFSGLGTKAGSPIGGWDQEGKTYQVGCRWNSRNLVSMVDQLNGLLKGRVRENRCTSYDACDVISAPGDDVVVYADPPYVSAGGALYEHSFDKQDHCRLAVALLGCTHRWLLSYDNDPLIHNLYASADIQQTTWAYTINSKTGHAGSEMLVLKGVSNPFSQEMAPQISHSDADLIGELFGTAR